MLKTYIVKYIYFLSKSGSECRGKDIICSESSKKAKNIIRDRLSKVFKFVIISVEETNLRGYRES